MWFIEGRKRDHVSITERSWQSGGEPGEAALQVLDDNIGTKVQRIILVHFT